MLVPTTKINPSDLKYEDLAKSSDDAEEPLEPLDEDPLDTDGGNVFEKLVNKLLIHSEVLLPQGENMVTVKVKRYSKNIEGDIVGEYNKDPMLNSIIYDIKFSDGEIKEYLANMIALNIYCQVDPDGYSTSLFDSIVGHDAEETTVKSKNFFVYTKLNVKRHHMTPKGLKCLVNFKNQSQV